MITEGGGLVWWRVASNFLEGGRDTVYCFYVGGGVRGTGGTLAFNTGHGGLGGHIRGSVILLVHGSKWQVSCPRPLRTWTRNGRWFVKNRGGTGVWPID